jgi:hypothetical protein
VLREHHQRALCPLRRESEEAYVLLIPFTSAESRIDVEEYC